ncbi:ABC transporter permease [Maritimibacter sp. HL-12]|uniref:ABC transporter permease n=1 Tax=Maritimibacter sp. HL-12 TaxID=1162418 RepID=UPI000A0F2AE7|nr:ABC transporter permease subunit [Maritimibacter sp. HL-12]SMH57276.1 putative thiamine transport system permease protein [Maritimibacter sp. HL-12]
MRGLVLAVLAFGLIGPIAAGLWVTARAGFGLMPAIGATEAGLDPWAALFGLPGLVTSLKITAFTGVVSTLLSLVLALALTAALQPRLSGGRAARLLAPFLAIPHAALAIGLAFVLAPSGWIARALAPVLGLDRPPDLALVGDPWGIALILGLMLKEVPFLMLVSLAALTQIPLRQHLATGRSLGYGRAAVWLKLIVPQLWPLIRLPVMVVLAYALSTVEMGLILGPSNPPVLAVLLTRLFFAPDTALLLPASAGALLQGALVAVAFALLWLIERALALAGRMWVCRGGRGRGLDPLLGIAHALGFAAITLGGLSMLALLIWSFAWRWPWPGALPESWSLRAWTGAGPGLARAFGQTLLIALATTGIALALAVAWLEGEDRARTPRAAWAEALIYLPLLLPQIAFLFGLNAGFLRLGLPGGLATVIWAQALFVFPYVMITLSDPWRALDPRLTRAAASLGAGPWRRLFTVKLPVLLAPILTAAAIGVAVSVAQYLPTLFMGTGRIATLTTEAVTLSSGSDRRVTGAYATLQMALPLAAYAAAFLIPALLHRDRRALKGGAA